MLGKFSFLILTIILSTARSETKPHACFKHYKVVPDALTVCPLSWAHVTFAGKKVCGGNVLTPTETKDEPKVKYDGEAGQFYTIAMINPDVPLPTKPERSFKNWLVVNVPGKNIKAGEVLAEYYSPGPIQDVGYYRYVIVIYKQPKKIDFKEEPVENNLQYEHRLKFDINKFAKKYKLGVPIAGNFFRAEWDESVPELHKKRGFVCTKDDGCKPVEEEAEGE